MTAFKKSWAVTVGINTYGHGIPTLLTAEADAARLADELETRHGYSVLRVLGAVSIDRLRDLLHTVLPGQVKEDHRVLFYYAGHGIAVDGDDGPAGYLIPHQGDSRNQSLILLPMQELHDALGALPCRHMLIILDCCFAGTLRWSTTREFGAAPDVVYRQRHDRYLQEAAWQAITSAAYNERALDVLDGQQIGERAGTRHSPFAEALFRGLAGDADLIPRAKPGRPAGDGVITATELYLYLRDSVEITSTKMGHQQTPGLWPLKNHRRGEYVLLVPGRDPDLPEAPELTEKNNPYRGLDPYDEQHSVFFFGRSKLIAVLHNRLRNNPLTIVVGPSGTGKSSVVKAGLLPDLRTAGEAWQIAPPVRPGKSPFDFLISLGLPRRAAYPVRVAQPADPSADDHELADRVGLWATANPDHEKKLVLVVDQLEELVTQSEGSDVPSRFIRQLSVALDRNPDRLRVLLTLRSDFEAAFIDLALKDRWMDSRLVIPPMSQDELREVIEGPASLRVVYFDPPELVDRLINDVVQTPAALPLLSFALRELYVKYVKRIKKGSEDRSLTLKEYEELGGVGGALWRRAEGEYESLPDDAHRATMQQVMLRTVSVEGGNLAGRRVPREELEYADSAENIRVAEVLRRLEAARLLVSDQDADGTPVVEPAHDELIRGWSRLREWVTSERERLGFRRFLTVAAGDWLDRHGGTWHANPRLSLAVSYLPVRPNGVTWLNAVEQSFVETSVRKRSRNRWFLGGGIAGAVFAIVSVVMIYSIQLMWTNDRLATRNYHNLIALARLKVEAGDFAQGERVLEACPGQHRGWEWYHLARMAQISRQVLRGHTAPVQGVFFNPADGSLLSADGDGVVDHWAAGTYNLGRPLRLPGGVKAVAASPDGKTFITASASGLIRGWDSRTGAKAFDVMANSKPPNCLGYSPDGRFIAAGFADGRVKVLRRGQEGPEELKLLTGHTRAIYGLAFDKDSKRLVSAGLDQKVCVWDTATWQKTIELPHDAGVLAVDFSRDGKRLISATMDGAVLEWPEPVAPDRRRQLNQFPDAVVSVAVSPDGQMLAVATGDLAVRLCAVSDGRELRVLREHTSLITSLAFDRDGARLASGGIDHMVVVWDVKANDARLSIELQGTPPGLVFNSDGDSVATRSGDTTVATWDTVSGKPVGTITDALPIRGFGFDAKSNRLAWVMADDYFAEDVQAGERSTLVRAHPKQSQYLLATSDTRLANGLRHALPFDRPVLKVAVSTSGRVIAYAEAYRSVSVLSDTGRVLGRYQGHEDWVTDLALAPNGRVLAIVTEVDVGSPERSLVVYDVVRGSELTNLARHRESIDTLAFSPDGGLLAVAVDKTGIEVRAVKTGKLLQTCRGHQGSVSCLMFSPDGTRLVSGGSDGTLRIWDLAVGEEFYSLRAHAAWVACVAFSPDGRLIASAGSDRTLRIWDGSTPLTRTSPSRPRLSPAPGQNTLPQDTTATLVMLFISLATSWAILILRARAMRSARLISSMSSRNRFAGVSRAARRSLRHARASRAARRAETDTPTHVPT
jgi:WD40 repeat protein